MLGLGSQKSDIDKVIESLSVLETSSDYSAPEEISLSASEIPGVKAQQMMNPRQAFFADSQMVNASDAAGLVSAYCFAPCPPGWAVLSPGQKIDAEDLKSFAPDHKVRVVKPVVNSSTLEGDSDGSNTAS